MWLMRPSGSRRVEEGHGGERPRGRSSGNQQPPSIPLPLSALVADRPYEGLSVVLIPLSGL